MDYKKILVLALAMSATAVAYSQEASSIDQLGQLEPRSAAAVPAPEAVITESGLPIINFGVAIWQNSESGAREGLVFRGAAPHGDAAFKFLGGLGVGTVIDFRVMRSDDKQLCADNKIDCREYSIVPTPTTKLTENSEFKEAFSRATAEIANGHKIYVHCRGGHHRTGALIAALTIRETACGRTFNKEQLGSSIEKTLIEYGFYTHSGGFHRFSSWEKEIRGWAENFEDNQWICK